MSPSEAARWVEPVLTGIPCRVLDSLELDGARLVAAERMGLVCTRADWLELTPLGRAFVGHRDPQPERVWWRLHWTDDGPEWEWIDDPRD